MNEHGFNVSSVENVETAFVAEWESNHQSNSEQICVGFISEYDALPKIGHACGHNLIAISGIGAALVFRDVIKTFSKNSIKIKCFGTPAEEGIICIIYS